MTACVYSILNLLNGHRYIGSAKNFRKRKWAHTSMLNCGTHPNIKLQRAWRKYGSSAFRFVVLSVIRCMDNLLESEQAWLDGYDPEYNIAKSSTAPMRGRLHSEDTKLRISLFWRGKTRSKETRRKMSEANLGKVYSSETLARMSAAQKGKKQSPELIEKKRQGNLRYWKDHKHSRLSLTCKNPKCGKVFERLPCQLTHPNSGSFCSVSCRGQVIGCRPWQKVQIEN